MDEFVTGMELELHAKVVSRYPRTLDECMKLQYNLEVSP